jgi:hypothetical protein
MIEVRTGQLAQLFGVHRNTITNWIKGGKLKATPTLAKRYLMDVRDLRDFCVAAGVPAHKFTAIVKEVGSSMDSKRDPVDTSISSQPSYQQSEVRMAEQLPRQPIGSVMVVGGGIAGIQASIDLANAGYSVHLIERSAGIGGAMAQLDKTYPTNDCAM